MPVCARENTITPKRKELDEWNFVYGFCTVFVDFVYGFYTVFVEVWNLDQIRQRIMSFFVKRNYFKHTITLKYNFQTSDKTYIWTYQIAS